MIKILCFAEKTDFISSLNKFLNNDEFNFVLSTGKVSLDNIGQRYIPDIILVDSSLQIISPLKIIQEIKANELFNVCPVLLMTEEEKLTDLDDHVEIGADEIIMKPFDLRYLITRIKIVYRMFLSKDNNPLTGLPGNKAIQKNIQQHLANQDQSKFAIIYSDLDHFKPYNDIYGFAKGDEIILFTAELLKEAIEKYGDKTDFFGHIGGDDFILITKPENVEKICNYICEQFDQKSPVFYNEQDRKNGFITAKDRDGSVKKFGLASVSLAVVSNQKRTFSSFVEISKVAAEVKKIAKGKEKSSWAMDKRGGDNQVDQQYLDKNNQEDRRSNQNKTCSILVVDDSKFIVDFIKNLLLLEGYEVEAETDAEKALFKLQIKKFNLIIVDISMPKIDGLTFIQEARKFESGKNVPIVIISAYNQKPIILQALKLGVKRFFVKPFDNKDLITTIAKILQCS